MATTSKIDDNSLTYMHEVCLNVKNREIYLHSYPTESGEESGIDYLVATRFIKNMHYLNLSAKKPITVHLHWDGGSWIDGMSIYDSISLSQSPITVIGYASVSSMSTIIMQAASTRLLMPNSEFMVHYGSMGVDGNAISVKSAVDQNELANKKMLEIYTEKCANSDNFKGYTEGRIKKFIDKKMKEKQEWYMTPQEAIDYGFADAIYGSRGY